MREKHLSRRASRRCYVSASPLTDLSELTAVMAEHNFTVISADRTPADLSLAEQVRRAIARADLVVGILGPENTSPNVYLELGFASGLGKSVLLLVPPGLKTPLVEAVGMIQVRAKPDNREALAFSLDNALLGLERTRKLPSKSHPDRSSEMRPSGASASEPRPPSPNAPPGKTRPIRQLADDLLSELIALERMSSTQRTTVDPHLESLVRRTLQAAGVSIVSQAQRRPDFAIWHDELQSTVGNPLLIELRDALTTRSLFDAAVRHLHLSLLETNALTGLLLYVRGPQEAVEPPSSLRILTVQLSDFIERLRDHSLAAVLRLLRNQATHYNQ